MHSHVHFHKGLFGCFKQFLPTPAPSPAQAPALDVVCVGQVLTAQPPAVPSKGMLQPGSVTLLSPWAAPLGAGKEPLIALLYCWRVWEEEQTAVARWHLGGPFQNYWEALPGQEQSFGLALRVLLGVFVLWLPGHEL